MTDIKYLTIEQTMERLKGDAVDILSMSQSLLNCAISNQKYIDKLIQILNQIKDIREAHLDGRSKEEIAEDRIVQLCKEAFKDIRVVEE